MRLGQARDLGRLAGRGAASSACQIKDEFEAAYVVWWPGVPYSEGAWARDPGDRLVQFSKADGRLCLGSAGASSHPSWQEGAVDAAWRTVEALHTRVMRG